MINQSFFIHESRLSQNPHKLYILIDHTIIQLQIKMVQEPILFCSGVRSNTVSSYTIISHEWERK